MPTFQTAVVIVTIASAHLAIAEQMDIATATSGLAEFNNICKESGERLWGKSLCGPGASPCLVRQRLG